MRRYKKILLVSVLSLFIFSVRLDTTYPETPPLYQRFFQKYLRSSYAQNLPDWAQMSPEKEGYEGTRTLEFYSYINALTPTPIPDTIIVAIMDSGFDIDHPALKDNIWNNWAEINGITGVDDDGNGFIDDYHGWNFLGDAVNLNYEFTREIQRLKRNGTPESDSYYKKLTEEFNNKKKEYEEEYKLGKDIYRQLVDAETVLKKKDYPTDPEKLKDIKKQLSGEYSEAANTIMFIKTLYGITRKDLEEMNKDIESKLSAVLDTTSAYRIIGDNPALLSEKNYGNSDVRSKGGVHGTHVAGIIGANVKGIGQAPFVRLMCIRVVPDEGDERDKDIANGIRYAVDNGASVINLSAGKYFASNPDFVIQAIRYAEEKGVLFVCAAGNEGINIEEKRNFPPKFYIENGEMKYFSNMIVVGASTWMTRNNSDKDPDNLARGFDLVASFSNFSDKVVDIFAPGVEINSTVPGGKFERLSGTSMASPEVAGVSAVLKSFFPALKAFDIKRILIASSRKYDGLKVKVGEKERSMFFSKLSKSGGIADLMNAYLRAKEEAGK